MTDRLEVEIGFLEGLRAELPEDLDVLRLLADDYTRAGRFKDGLDADLELAKRLPDDALVHYNLACSFSLLNQVEESARVLLKAIQLGYDDLAWLRKDPDLANVRKSPLFHRVLESLGKK
ncbi:MAG: hypothetical protein PHV34_06260 [Verrucomicrobiae bacterium]|nr:hypothetical protein [Verrucomicrobiae bacterium]